MLDMKEVRRNAGHEGSEEKCWTRREMLDMKEVMKNAGHVGSEER